MPGKSAVELLRVRDVKNSERLESAYARGRVLEIMSWMTTTFATKH
jgi:hypothetical protein